MSGRTKTTGFIPTVTHVPVLRSEIVGCLTRFAIRDFSQRQKVVRFFVHATSALSVVTENAKDWLVTSMSPFSILRIKSETRHCEVIFARIRVYTVYTDERVQDLLSDLHLADSFFGLETGIDEADFSRRGSRPCLSLWRFLANGSIRDPESGEYQLEISSVYLDHAQGIASLQQFLLDAKVLGGARRGCDLSSACRRHYGLLDRHRSHEGA